MAVFPNMTKLNVWNKIMLSTISFLLYKYKDKDSHGFERDVSGYRY